MKNQQHVMYMGGFGDDIKMSDDGKIQGWLVRYGSPTQHDATKNRDFFTEQTDFDFNDGDVRSILHEHGFSPIYGGESIGQVKMFKRPQGVWCEGVIKSDIAEREKLINDIKAKKYGFSSGSQGYRIQRERKSNGANEIKRWPIGEASITTDPAEPGMRTAVGCVKTVAECKFADDMKSSIYIRLEDYNWEDGNDTTLATTIREDSPTDLKARLAEVQSLVALYMDALVASDADMPAKSLAAEEAYMKMGAKISKSNGKHMVTAHDAICAIYPDACPAQSKKTAAKSLVDTALLDQLTEVKTQLNAATARVAQLETEVTEVKTAAAAAIPPDVATAQAELAAKANEVATLQAAATEAETKSAAAIAEMEAKLTAANETIARHEETIKTRLVALGLSATNRA